MYVWILTEVSVSKVQVVHTKLISEEAKNLTSPLTSFHP